MATGNRKETKTGKTDKANKVMYRQFGELASAGFVFPVSIAIGYAIGYYLDQWLGTRWLTLTFLLFGIAAGFVGFFRTISRLR